MPALQMQLGWDHRTAQILETRNPHAADIAGETYIFKHVSVVVLGMTRRIDRQEFQVAD